MCLRRLRDCLSSIRSSRPRVRTAPANVRLAVLPLEQRELLSVTLLQPDITIPGVGTVSGVNLTDVGPQVYFAMPGKAYPCAPYCPTLMSSNGTRAGTVNVTPSAPPTFLGGLENINGSLVVGAMETGIPLLPGWNLYAGKGVPAPLLTTVPHNLVGASPNVYIYYNMNGQSWIGVNTLPHWGQTTTVFSLVTNPYMGVMDLTPVGSAMYFVAGTPAQRRLWYTPGTAAGTHAILGAYTAAPNQNAHDVTALGNNAFFVTDVYTGTQITGENLWMFNAATQTVQFVQAFKSVCNDPGGPDHFLSFNGAVYFGADDGVHGPQLWRTTGPGATAMISNIPKPAVAVTNYLTHLTGVGADMVYFVVNTPASQLWMSRAGGSAALVHDFAPTGAARPDSLTAAGTRLYFAASTTQNARDLWVTDGTTTQELFLAGPTQSSLSTNPSVSPFLTYNATLQKLFFVGNVGATGAYVHGVYALDVPQGAPTPGGSSGKGLPGDAFAQAAAAGTSLPSAAPSPNRGARLAADDFRPGAVSGSPDGYFATGPAVVGEALDWIGTATDRSSLGNDDPISAALGDPLWLV